MQQLLKSIEILGLLEILLSIIKVLGLIGI